MLQRSNTSSVVRGLILGVVGLVSLFAIAACGDDPEGNDSPDPTAEPDVTFEMEAEGRVFIVDGEQNPELNVEEGDVVEVDFCVTEGTHDWVVDEFDGAATDILTADQCETIQFTADQQGSFEYYCSVGSHREEGMEGTFVVGEPEDDEGNDDGNGEDEGDNDETDEEDNDEADEEDNDDNGDNGDPVGEPDVVFELDAYSNYYTHQGESEQNPELVVDEGDVVEVEMCIQEGNHDWVVDEFDAATDVISTDCDTVQFTADAAGSYDYYCSVGNHRAQGMEGTLTVE